MKKAVYILAAILTAAFTVFFVIDMINFINDEYRSFFDYHNKAFFWQAILTYLITVAASLAYVILSLIQLRKETPRLILLFAGCAFFSSTSIVFAEKWWIPAIYLIAGILPAVYVFIKYGKLVKAAPMQRQRYNGCLIAAGVLSCMCIAMCIYSLLSNMSFYEGFDSDVIASVYYSSAISVIQYICIAVFCFLMYRRTGVLYRMFFSGSSTVGVLNIFPQIVYIILIAAEADHFRIDPRNIIGMAVSLALVLLVLIHAFKTRRDGILPQEPIHLPQQQTEMPSV